MDIRITIVYSPAAREIIEASLVLPAGSTVAQALAVSGLLLPFGEVSATDVGVWGQKVRLDRVLSDQDRIELYRPLKVDPKLARRNRFAAQGARGAGLFARKRPGAKAGY